MEGEFLLNPLFERSAFLESERVGLCDDRDNVDNVGELLQDDNVNRFEGMARGLDEEQAAMDAGILNVAFSLSGEFFSEVGRMLVFDVFDNGIPAERS